MNPNTHLYLQEFFFVNQTIQKDMDQSESDTWQYVVGMDQFGSISTDLDWYRLDHPHIDQQARWSTGRTNVGVRPLNTDRWLPCLTNGRPHLWNQYWIVSMEIGKDFFILYLEKISCSIPIVACCSVAVTLIGGHVSNRKPVTGLLLQRMQGFFPKLDRVLDEVTSPLFQRSLSSKILRTCSAGSLFRQLLFGLLLFYSRSCSTTSNGAVKQLLTLLFELQTPSLVSTIL